MKKVIVISILALGILFGSISYSYAEPVRIEWDGMGCSEDIIFDFDLQFLPDQNAYTLEGKAAAKINGFTYPARGGVVFNPVTNKFQISIIYTSATGETFTFGASLDISSFDGEGTAQRIAHGAIGADCAGIMRLLSN